MTDYLHNCWNILVALAPWLLLGAGVAGALHVLLPPNFVRQHLGSGKWQDVFKAAFFGVPLPLCSCGVIPAGVGLRKDGASDGASIAFLISTPQTGVDSIAVSAAFLGWPFAIFKLFSAFVTGLVGGLLTNWTVPAKPTQPAPGPEQPPTQQVSPTDRTFKEAVSFAVDDLLHSIWKWVVFGILVSALLSLLLPDNSLADKTWTQGIWGMFAVLAVSIPLYVCATGSVPIAAALVAAGLPPGTALVFLMAGPATNVATLGAVGKTFGRRVTLVYLLAIVIGSVGLGYAFDFVIPADVAASHLHQGAHLGVIAPISAAALLLMFVMFAWKDLRNRLQKRGSAHSADADEQFTFAVTGVHCEGCAGKIRSGLSKLHGVTAVQVDVEGKTVTLSGADFQHTLVQQTVRDLGYGVAPDPSTPHETR